MPSPIVILPDPPPPGTPVGLIAAGGRLPLLVAEGMKKCGHEVRCAAMRGQYVPELRALCDEFREVGALSIGAWGRALRGMGVRHAVMVGRLDKARIMHHWAEIFRNAPDLKAMQIWFKLRHDRRSHLMLTAVADALTKYGVDLIDSTAHISDHMATSGVMTSRQPTPGQRADIEFGWPILVEMLRLDIGQAIAVRERDVIAVEAVEGTDRMIQRAGELCRSQGWVLLKGARAGHDRRADVPTVGPETIRTLHAAGGRCLAIASGDVIMVDKGEMISLADKLGVSIIGRPVVG